MHTILLFGSRF